MKKLILIFVMLGAAGFFTSVSADEDSVFKVKEAYYESGQLESSGEVSFDDGVYQGILKEYYENGKLKSETNFRDGKINGIVRDYYESGQLLSEANFKDGKADGLRKKYYENGTLESEVSFKDGKEISRKEYDKKGKLVDA